MAVHDYAHEGLYVRTAPLREHADGVTVTWGIWTAPGRQVLPTCCRNKRTYVPEEPVNFTDFLPGPERKRAAVKARSRAG